MSGETDPQSADHQTDAKHPLEERLAEFFTHNPDAGFEAREEGPCRITTPWGDDSLRIGVSEDAGALIASLNSLYLPPRFTAIYHRDRKDFEIIWTAFEVSPEFSSRAFEFSFGGDSIRCEFAPASDRLIEIGRAANPAAPATQTGHRNLYEFNLYAHYVDEHPDTEMADVTPMSFWMYDIVWDDTQMRQLARHLNFYMAFFDRQAPTIQIHEAPSREEPKFDPVRFPSDEFPEHISGSQLDSHLLSLWESAHLKADPFKQFVYNYQILEYIAFYHIRDEVRRDIRRLLREPDLLDRPDEFAKQAAESLSREQLHDIDKFKHTVRDLVKPETLWKSIGANREYYAASITFDGGFEVEALIREEWGLTDFERSWHPAFADTIRHMRNALVHGREEKQTSVILPTSRNYNLLKPWIDPLSLAASQAMVYWEH